MTTKKALTAAISCASAAILVFGGLIAVRKMKSDKIKTDDSDSSESVTVTEDFSDEDETVETTVAPVTEKSETSVETTAPVSTTISSTTKAASTTKKTTTTKKGNTTGTTTKTVGGHTTVVTNSGGTNGGGGGNTTQATTKSTTKNTTTTAKPNTTTTTTTANNQQTETQEITPPDISYVTSTSVNGTSCTLTWKQVECDGYEIWYAGADTLFVENWPINYYKLGIDIPNGNITTATVSNLVSESNYCFQIQPYKYNNDGSKLYGFYSVENNTWHEEIETEGNADEEYSNAPTWETTTNGVTVRIDYEKTKEFIDAVNQERVSAGVQPLAISARFMNTAALRAAEFSVLASFHHVRPNGLICSSVGANNENIGGGYSPFTDTPHRNLMLGSQFSSTGAAVVELNDKYGTSYFVVQHYGGDADITESYQYPATGDYTFQIESKVYHWSY
ncbi:hypothetical protein SAMN02910447_03314 [Ruminococcus sp. YE71]|uniref:CAP domain-containing protein n=1 Tax=unclassified Ruminococcus TaxID=2608920 RepID=UPI00087EC23E|nr:MULTISPECIES: CAP domain-containing protein [unclassified Ruminococcus]SDA31032.1 hypothetical protein SAMN02910446_03383 [Ruminococcus sp. YE78]SFW50896.1 hypothetical protein SAMN02910447_03314 [Ruminococcus sp. YE71]